MCTKKGPVEIKGFTMLDQLKQLRDVNYLIECVAPTTNTITPTAHLMFKISLANINPRLGSRSNFDVQDITTCAMILANKKFDLFKLILRNMYDFSIDIIPLVSQMF